MAGAMIRVTSRDGFELDAWHVKAEGPRKGGVIVIQEIFGLSDHIKEMAERFGAAGYEAIAPSIAWCTGMALSDQRLHGKHCGWNWRRLFVPTPHAHAGKVPLLRRARTDRCCRLQVGT